MLVLAAGEVLAGRRVVAPQLEAVDGDVRAGLMDAHAERRVALVGTAADRAQRRAVALEGEVAPVADEDAPPPRR